MPGTVTLSDDRPFARPGVAIWGPFVSVMLLLGALAMAPLLTSARARGLRTALSDGAEPALVRVNDLEATLATELYTSVGGEAGRARYGLALTQESSDLAALAAFVAHTDSASRDALAALRDAVARWHRAPADEATGIAALDAAQRLETDLERFAEARRAELRRAVQLDVRTAVALVPLAVVGVALLAWTSWRMAALAQVADERRERLAAAARNRDALLRAVSHDLRNPLGAASGYLELLLGTDAYGPLGAAQREPVSRAQRLVRSALQSASDLLDLARAEAGQLAMRDVPVVLDALVREVVDDHAAVAAHAGLSLTLSAPNDDAPPAPEISTDPERVRQVLTNLLSNAIKYTPRGGAVEVSVRRPPGASPAIEVRDTGPGIPRELRERVFEEAVRLPGAHALAPGAGIGLAAARRVARALGGELTVDDAPTRGAAFTLWLG